MPDTLKCRWSPVGNGHSVGLQHCVYNGMVLVLCRKCRKQFPDTIKKIPKKDVQLYLAMQAL